MNALQKESKTIMNIMMFGRPRKLEWSDPSAKTQNPNSEPWIYSINNREKLRKPLDTFPVQAVDRLGRANTKTLFVETIVIIRGVGGQFSMELASSENPCRERKA